MQAPSQAQVYLRPPSALDRKTMGKYEVLCRLATGGMAEIFLAWQRGLAGFRKIVVLKSILPDVRGEEELVRMFLAEAQTTAQFNHPHIAQVFDLDVDGDVLFLAMEFVQGCTLIELARAADKAKEAIPVGFTLRVARDTALALHYAHTFTDARGRKLPVIHRDVAEKNIMVTHQGITKLLDFGIAKTGAGKLTAVGTVKGSTGYMSPEQIRGETVDLRSDVFSLGVVLHECLTGYRLFRGRTPEESMMKALEANVLPPSLSNAQISPELDRAVLKALERDREHRYETALELARELERVGGALLWSPEQCGELVQRHFAFRQEQVRELVRDMEHGNESNISQVVAAIQAAQGAPLAAAAGPVLSPPLPAAARVSDETVPAPISEVKRAIDQALGKTQERTDELPSHHATIVGAPPRREVTAVAAIDFSRSPGSDVTPSLPRLDSVTDVSAAYVPSDRPTNPDAPPLSTEVVASLLQSTPKPPLPPPSSDPQAQITAPAVQAPFPMSAPAPALAAVPQSSRRVMRRQRSRAPLYGFIALVWAAALVAVLMVMQVGPFKPAPPRPVIVPVTAPPEPARPPPDAELPPEPEPADPPADDAEPAPAEPAPAPTAAPVPGPGQKHPTKVKRGKR